MPIGAQIMLNQLWLASNLQTGALLPVVVPAQVALVLAGTAVGGAAQAAYLGWLSAGAAVVAILVQPLVGFWSDRTRSRWGRRRPHLVWGVAVQMGGAAALIGARNAWTYALAFLALIAGNNVTVAAYQGLFADRVPVRQRGAASGVYGLMTILGTAGSFGLALALLGSASAAHPTSLVRGSAIYFLATLALLGVAGLILALGVGEARLPRPTTAAWHDLRSMLRTWTEPWRHRNYTWVFIARFLFMIGFTLFLTFIEYYFAQVEHASNYIESTAEVALMALGVAVTSSIVLGVLSDRTRRVPLALLATLVMALAAVLFTVGGARIPLWWLGALFGLGYGAYFSVDWALAVDSLPSLGAAGRDLGLWSLSGSVGQVMAPALGSGIIVAAAALGSTRAGYQAVFGGAAVFFVGAALAVLGIREASPGSPPPE